MADLRPVTVILALASGPGVPEGVAGDRYELRVVLDARGRLDPEVWRRVHEPWPARRIQPGEPAMEGDVQYDPDEGWWLRFFRRAAEGPDVPAHYLDPGSEPLRPGSYVTVTGPDGIRRDYRVVGVG